MSRASRIGGEDGPAKATMKLRRYKARGMTQRSGMGARSVVRYVVTPISQLETEKTSTSQPSIVRRGSRAGERPCPLVGDGDRPWDSSTDSAREEHAGHEGDREQDESLLPESRLRIQSQVRFDGERISQQRDEAAGIARGVEEVGIVGPGMARHGEPSLNQRSRGRDDEERDGR